MCAIFVVLTIRQRANDLQRWSLISIPKVFFFFFHHEHVIHEWWPGCFRRVTAFSPFVSQNDTTREMYYRVLFIWYWVLIFIFTRWYCSFTVWQCAIWRTTKVIHKHVSQKHGKPSREQLWLCVVCTLSLFVEILNIGYLVDLTAKMFILSATRLNVLRHVRILNNLTLTWTLWGDQCLDAVACEGSRSIRSARGGFLVRVLGLSELLRHAVALGDARLIAPIMK